MRSLSPRTHRAFAQALACARFHPLAAANRGQEEETASAALRAGLFGAAAVHALLDEHEDETELLDALGEFADLAADAFVRDERGRLRFRESCRRVLDDYAPLHRRVSDPGVCLRIPAEFFVEAHVPSVLRGVPWTQRRSVRRRFSADARASVALAQRLYERRRLDLDEVAGIALIGE